MENDKIYDLIIVGAGPADLQPVYMQVEEI